MAPKSLDVRSESWLNLSDRIGHSRARKPAPSPNPRHSISDLYFLEQFSYPEPLDLLSEPQHLLIRMRQRSYLSSRCTSVASMSTATNLSLSVELNQAGEQRSGEPRFQCSGGEPAQVKLKRQPLRLTSLKDSLEKKRRRSGLSPCHDLNSRASPFVRSFSSVSERLSDRLSSIRQSWKQFLYQYSSGGGRARAKAEAGAQVPAEEPGARPLMATVDKRQLTNDWVKRHPKETTGDLAFLRARLRPADSPESRDRSRAGGGQVHHSSRPSSLLVESDDEPALQPLTRRQDADNCSNSSSNSNSNKREYRNLRQECSGRRSSSTLVSKQSSATPVERAERTGSGSESTLESRQESGAARTKPAMSHQIRPTSDYWSSASATDSHLYYRPPAEPAEQLERRSLDADYYYQVEELERRYRCEPASHAPAAIPGHLADYEADDYGEDYAVPADESCRLDRSQVELVQMIGEGQKGFVFLGKLQSRDGRHLQQVAIKTLKYETEQLIEKLMQEAHLMRQLEHPHIIRFIGVCPETPALIAMELAQLGEVKQYLKLNEHLIPLSHLVLFTFQISTALSYLEGRKCVHRDVAARNVLVCSPNCVKLADFGLSRDLQLPAGGGANPARRHTSGPAGFATPDFAGADERSLLGAPASSFYVATAHGKLPIRWLAPESLIFKRFTSATDVWMFAVCAWELFHFGHLRPWAGIRNGQVLGAIEAGQRLARPPACPQRLYQLMLQCWCYAPQQRPKFRELKQSLWSIYLAERTREQLHLEQRQRRRQLNDEGTLLLAGRHALAPAPKQGSSSPLQSLQPAAAPAAASYSSTASGYSSNPTAQLTDLSNSSSRCSTLGSLARRSGRQPSRASELSSAAEPHRLLPDEQQQAPPARRFRQRIPGHVLQKQLSQGSIMGAGERECTADRAAEKRRIKDDQMILRQLVRPMSELYVGYGAPANLASARHSALEPAEGGQKERLGAACCRAKPQPDNWRRPLARCDTVPHYEGVTIVPVGASSSTPQAEEEAQQEVEQRQLALHQRLIGNIRLPKLAGRQPGEANHTQNQRRSVNLEPQSGSPQTPSEAVDQSLQILESLITGAQSNLEQQRNCQQAPKQADAEIRDKAAHSRPTSMKMMMMMKKSRNTEPTAIHRSGAAESEKSHRRMGMYFKNRGSHNNNDKKTT